MSRLTQHIIKLSTISLMVVSLISFFSCEKEEKESPYIGVWDYESSTPELDPSYFNSYIEIFEDYSYTLYDSSRDLIIAGEKQRFSKLEMVVIEPGTNREFRIKILGMKDGRMTIRSDYFGEEIVIVLLRR